MQLHGVFIDNYFDGSNVQQNVLYMDEGKYVIKVLGFGSPPVLQCFVCSQLPPLIKSLDLELVSGNSMIARLICLLFKQGAYPDYDKEHPKISIIKVVCCKDHVDNLNYLRKLLDEHPTITKELIAQSQSLKK